MSRDAGSLSDRLGYLEGATRTVEAADPSAASRTASQLGRRVLGPAGQALDVAEMQTGYMADRRRMPADEAFVKNYGAGGLKLGARFIGAGVGGVLGGAGAGAVSAGAAVPVGGVAGGVIGAMAGDRIAEPAAEALLPLYRAGKRYSDITVEELKRVAREASVYNTPRFWLNRRGPPSLYGR